MVCGGGVCVCLGGGGGGRGRMRGLWMGQQDRAERVQ